MPPIIRPIRLLVCAGLAAGFGASIVFVGCGDTVRVETTPGDGGNGGFGAGVGEDGGPIGGGGTGPDGGGELDAFVEQPCPDAGPPIEDFQCDPYNQGGQCPPGEGCFIYVQYPSEPCGQEIYGSLCFPAGAGSQGDPCNGPQNCQAGFACVVSGAGTQCVQLCPLTGEDGCPAGLVCEAIDVGGFGGCL